VALDRLDDTDPLHPVLLLAADLVNSYDRLDLSISANMAPATHGETRHEVLGSGDASQPFQRFTLKQSPLTYVSSPSAKGADSTLEIRVNGIAWHELPSFYRQGPRMRGYVVRVADNHSATVEFGDGITGARLPSGIENVTATYRSGIGRDALVRAGQVSLLQTRPLGVKTVSNPVAASGADDPEPMSQARRNAPATVVTFDRVVSLTDFADFAAAFPGIGKAHATWLWRDHTALVHVTVAGAGGTGILPGSELCNNLVAATRRTGIFRQPFTVQPADSITFAVTAGIYRDPDYEWPAVKNTARSALLGAFSFDARDLAQPVTESEVLAVLQGVPGVQGIRLVLLGASGVTGGVAAMVPSLPARVLGTDVLPAQLLTIDPALITLTEQT
jgi:predicted phage baseplate assembly protein